jgi:hypothetical protein
MINKIWKEYKGKRVRLIIEDFNSFPKPKDGLFIDSDETHIFLQLDNKVTPIPFLKSSVKRIDIKEVEDNEENINGNTKYPR